MKNAQKIRLKQLQRYLERTRQFLEVWGETNQLLSEFVQEGGRINPEKRHQIGKNVSWLAEHYELTGLSQDRVMVYYERVGNKLFPTDPIINAINKAGNLEGALMMVTGRPNRVAVREFSELWNGGITVISRYIGWLRERIHQIESGEAQLIIQELSPESIEDIIRRSLRKCVHVEQVEKEVQIQDALESVFSVSNIEYNREQTAIPTSDKSSIPDFTIESLLLAIEVKLVKSDKDKKRIIDEIMADIGHYAKRYSGQIFVVYDLGIIKNEEKFQRGLASDSVNIIVVKH